MIICSSGEFLNFKIYVLNFNKWEQVFQLKKIALHGYLKLKKWNASVLLRENSTWFEIDPNKRLRGILNRRDAHVSEKPPYSHCFMREWECSDLILVRLREVRILWQKSSIFLSSDQKNNVVSRARRSIIAKIKIKMKISIFLSFHVTHIGLKNIPRAK